MAPAYVGLMAGVILVSVYNSRLKRQIRNKNKIKINTESIDKINKNIKR